MVIIEGLIGVLIVVTFVIVFVLGASYGENKAKKAMDQMLINQHACLNWALQYALPLDEDGKPIADEYMSRWYDEYGMARLVSKGDINALLS